MAKNKIIVATVSIPHGRLVPDVVSHLMSAMRHLSPDIGVTVREPDPHPGPSDLTLKGEEIESVEVDGNEVNISLKDGRFLLLATPDGEDLEITGESAKEVKELPPIA